MISLCVPQAQFKYIKFGAPYSHKEAKSVAERDGYIENGEELSHVLAELHQQDKIHWLFKNESIKDRRI